MKTKLVMILAAATVVATTGCASGGMGMNNRQLGTATGAVVGGIVGNAALGGPIGTLGGAAAGALIGNEMSKSK